MNSISQEILDYEDCYARKKNDMFLNEWFAKNWRVRQEEVLMEWEPVVMDIVELGREKNQSYWQSLELSENQSFDARNMIDTFVHV